MNLQDTFHQYLIRLATPDAVGVGFYAPLYNLIITNAHLVSEYPDVVVHGPSGMQRIARVLFSAPKSDVAFIEMPWRLELEPLVWADTIKNGEDAMALGLRPRHKVIVEEGFVVRNDHLENNIPVLEVSTPILPHNSGGPLVNENHAILGLNTFVPHTRRFSLAVQGEFLRQLLDEYRSQHGRIASRCINCETMVWEHTVEDGGCPNCAEAVILPNDLPPYEPSGIPRVVEEIIADIGHEVELTRRGLHRWEIQQGSAQIEITYNAKSGYVLGDAMLCHQPLQQRTALYTYLLEQNAKLEGLNFSIQDDAILLTLMIYDRYLNRKTGAELFQRLFEQADHYDNILVEEYGAVWCS